MNSYDSQAASSPVVRCDVKNCQYHEKDGSCSAGQNHRRSGLCRQQRRYGLLDL